MRPSFDFALKQLPILKAIEVGVYEGENASRMITSNLGFLYLIDPYKAHINNSIATDTAIYKVTQEEMDRAKKLAMERMLPFPGRYIFMELTSEEASKLFEDNSIDYIYIDAIHSYDEVKKDIALWFPKVRVGGVLSGHDYAFGSHTGETGYRGLMKAVNEFVQEKGLKLYNPYEDWWVVKNE
jgi:hypothetical protein